MYKGPVEGLRPSTGNAKKKTVFDRLFFRQIT